MRTYMNVHFPDSDEELLAVEAEDLCGLQSCTLAIGNESHPFGLMLFVKTREQAEQLRDATQRLVELFNEKAEART